MVERSSDVAGVQRLGEELREARRKKGLTQTAAAERAEVSATLWQQLEKGVRYDGKPLQPKAKTVIDVAIAVGLEPTRALEVAGLDPSAYEPARRPRRTASESEMLDLFSRLTVAQRQALVEFLNLMVDQAQPEPEPEEQQEDRPGPNVPMPGAPRDITGSRTESR